MPAFIKLDLNDFAPHVLVRLAPGDQQATLERIESVFSEHFMAGYPFEPRYMDDDYQQFYDDELQLRQELHYPPFATFIHLTWCGSKAQNDALATEIESRLRTYPLSIYKAPTPQKGKEIRYGLIRITEGTPWPDTELIGILKNLPPNIRVVVNPDRII